MAVSGTAVVKYALYGLDGRLIPGSNAIIGTSFAGGGCAPRLASLASLSLINHVTVRPPAGTRAQAFVGGNGEFYIVTTAR